VLRGSTGPVPQAVQGGTKNLTQLVHANKAVAKGDVLDAGLVSSDSDSGRRPGRRRQQGHQHGEPKGEQRHYRLQLSLVRHQGHWLVSDLTFRGLEEEESGHGTQSTDRRASSPGLPFGANAGSHRRRGHGAGSSAR
jgi:hypothetical protein